jgi:uncharacterized protein YkwD
VILAAALLAAASPAQAAGAVERPAWGDGELRTPAAAMRMWLESPPHRRAIYRRAYREMGVGVAEGTPANGEGATYAVVLGGRGRR